MNHFWHLKNCFFALFQLQKSFLGLHITIAHFQESELVMWEKTELNNLRLPASWHQLPRQVVWTSLKWASGLYFDPWLLRSGVWLHPGIHKAMQNFTTH